MVLAQAVPPKVAAKAAPYTIHAVVFQGTTPYSEAALEAAAGLKVGSPMTSEDLQEAAERLISTGAFGDVGATLDGPLQSVTVIFKVSAADPVHMLRASFDNFVWFSHEELVAELKKRVPLFNDFVPEGGSVQGAVQDALQQMLIAKGVSGKVSSQLVAPRPGQPFRVAEYHVTSPEVRLQGLEIAGIPAAFKPATDVAVLKVRGKAYSDGLVGGYQERVLMDYWNAGYLDAALTQVRTTIASTTPQRVEVDVAATLKTGEVYRVSKLNWAGSPQMNAETFQSVAKLHAGDVASQTKLNESLESLDATYRNQGYVDVILDAGPKLDTAAHQVAYDIKATPGPQYKIRDINVQGLTPAQRKEFDSAWRLKTGDVYNAGYVKNFLQNNTAMQSLAQLSASFKVMEEPESGVLDLNISFFKDPTK
ncbi:hypothetical protein BH10ACI4_BH10ACI4_35180 [soil metagenome]